MSAALINHKLFDGESWHSDKAVLIDGTSIADVIPLQSRVAGIKTIDLGGQILAPGFIDVQVNGGGGTLFNDQPSVDGIRNIVKAHRRYGTTGLLPTLITDDLETMAASADAVRQLVASPAEGVLGIHFEGPYVNTRRKGVHDAALIRPPEEEGLELFLSDDLGVVVVTVAPEILDPGIIRRLATAGVRVCAGHTAADYEQIETALTEGLCGFTHLFNAMTPMESRAPGVVGAALQSTSSWCGIIVDGFHVHPASLQLALKTKVPGKMILVTDAMPSVGAITKDFILQGRAVNVRNGRCLTDDGTLAGSDLDMIGAVGNTVGMLGCELSEALRMASLYPAEFLGLGDRFGRILPGYRADLVAFDPAFRVNQTWVAGNALTH